MELVAAAAEQMAELPFFPSWGWANEPSTRAAEMIAARAPGDLNEVFFVNSGSEAVESALKFIRAFHLANGDPQRTEVISRDWCYHGTTLTALQLTGVPGFTELYKPYFGDFTHKVRNTKGDTPDALASAAAIEAKIIELGPENVAAVFAEPIQNGGGALVPPDGYWAELRRICDEHGVLLVADEVISGFGRFGHWFCQRAVRRGSRHHHFCESGNQCLPAARGIHCSGSAQAANQGL